METSGPTLGFQCYKATVVHHHGNGCRKRPLKSEKDPGYDPGFGDLMMSQDAGPGYRSVCISISGFINDGSAKSKALTDDSYCLGQTSIDRFIEKFGFSRAHFSAVGDDELPVVQ